MNTDAASEGQRGHYRERNGDGPRTFTLPCPCPFPNPHPSPIPPVMRPDLTPWRTELRATLALAWPLALANMLQMLVYAIDVVFVARLGQQALAASSLSLALFALLAWSFSAMTAAVAPLIAAELGRGRHAVREVRRTVRMGLWLALMLAAGGMVVCGQGEAILRATGQDPAVAARAGGFLAVMRWSLPAAIAANVLRVAVSAMGRPIFATAITALAIAVNALGNYAFVFGHFGAPALGLNGSALSSVIVSLATLAAYAMAIRADGRLRRYRLFGNWWRAEWSRLGQLVRIGLPIGLTVAAEAGLFGGAAFLMGLIGEAQLAGHAVALQIASLSFQLPLGIGQAATIRVGYHFGADDRAGARRAGWLALAVGVGFALAAGAAMVLVPRPIIAAYVDIARPANAVMVGFAVRFLRVAAAFQLVDSAQAIAAGALRGLQDTRAPLVIALFGYWIAGFGCAVLLGFGTRLAGTGIWIGLAVGLLVVAILLLRRWTRLVRRWPGGVVVPPIAG